MSKERPEQHELDPALVTGYMATFINRTDVFPLQRDDGRYVSIKRPLTADLVVAHLLGRQTIGAYALDHANQAKWICFDADNDDHWLTLQTLANTLRALRVPAYCEQSRRGGHVWLFFASLPGRDALVSANNFSQRSI